MITGFLNHENMRVDTNFTDLEPQIPTLYQYFNFYSVSA